MNIWKYARAQWDRTAAGALFALGGLALVLGWIGVSKEALTALQIPYIVSGGLGGIFLLGLGAVFWLSADMRDEWRKLDALEQAVGHRGPESNLESNLDSDDSWLDDAATMVGNDDATTVADDDAAGRNSPVTNHRAPRSKPIRAS